MAATSPRFSTIISLPLAIGLAGAATPNPAPAQIPERPPVQVRATAVSQPLEVSGVITKLNDLRFEELIAGTDHPPIHPGGPGSALFRISGQTGQQFEIWFDRIPNLLHYGNNGLRIVFDGSSAAWSRSNDPEGATRFDPRNPIRVNLTRGSTEVYVWLGASVVLSENQSAGQYAGEVTLRAERVGGPRPRNR